MTELPLARQKNIIPKKFCRYFDVGAYAKTILSSIIEELLW